MKTNAILIILIAICVLILLTKMFCYLIPVVVFIAKVVIIGFLVYLIVKVATKKKES